MFRLTVKQQSHTCRNLRLASSAASITPHQASPFQKPTCFVRLVRALAYPALRSTLLAGDEVAVVTPATTRRALAGCPCRCLRDSHAGTSRATTAANAACSCPDSAISQSAAPGICTGYTLKLWHARGERHGASMRLSIAAVRSRQPHTGEIGALPAASGRLRVVTAQPGVNHAVLHSWYAGWCTHDTILI
jgi:Tfp pilus assembly protein PilW